MRLDCILCQKGYYSSRTKAKDAILAGLVKLDGKIIKQPDYIYQNQTIATTPWAYVSRGGDKLLGAIRHLKINLKDLVALDIGCSTGGFSDCLLQQGCKYVYGIDVGTDQIDSKLLENKKFQCYQNCHFENLKLDLFTKSLMPQLVVADVSFISITKVIAKIASLFSNIPISCLFLIKPQFEVGNDVVKKTKGLVTKRYHQAVLDKIANCVKDYQFQIVDIFACDLKGKKLGNQEYFIYFHN